MISFFNSDKIDVNSTRSIASIIYLAVVGVCVFIVQPGFVQGLVERLGLSPEEAGYIASAEMWGLAISTILLTVIAHRYDWQKMTFYFLVIAVVGNLASIGQTDLLVLGSLRALTGLGLGGMISLPFAMMGLTQNPDRNFGFIIVWVLVYGALGMFAIPWALNTIQFDGILVFLALFCAAGLLCVRHLPRCAADHLDEAHETGEFPILVKASALVGILVFNLAIGIVWAYIFLVGVNAGLGEQTVANILTISQFLGVAGALLAAAMAIRIGRSLPLSLAIIGCGAGVAYLLGDVDYLVYSIAIYLFNFMWNVAQPYLLATLAGFADGGRTIIQGACLQMIGFAVGPYVGARLLQAEGLEMFDMVNMVGAIMFIISWILILPAMRLQQQAS